MSGRARSGPARRPRSTASTTPPVSSAMGTCRSWSPARSPIIARAAGRRADSAVARVVAIARCRHPGIPPSRAPILAGQRQLHPFFISLLSPESHPRSPPRAGPASNAGAGVSHRHHRPRSMVVVLRLGVLRRTVRARVPRDDDRPCFGRGRARSRRRRRPWAPRTACLPGCPTAGQAACPPARLADGPCYCSSHTHAARTHTRLRRCCATARLGRRARPSARPPTHQRQPGRQAAGLLCHAQGARRRGSALYARTRHIAPSDRGGGGRRRRRCAVRAAAPRPRRPAAGCRCRRLRSATVTACCSRADTGTGGSSALPPLPCSLFCRSAPRRFVRAGRGSRFAAGSLGPTRRPRTTVWGRHADDDGDDRGEEDATGARGGALHAPPGSAPAPALLLAVARTRAAEAPPCNRVPPRCIEQITDSGRRPHTVVADGAALGVGDNNGRAGDC